MPCLGFDPWEAMATKFQGQLHGQRRKISLVRGGSNFWTGGQGVAGA